VLKDVDDDGFRWNLHACGPSTVTFAINASMLPAALQTAKHTAYLNAWFDWNKDGKWSGGTRCGLKHFAPEWGVQNVPVTLDKLAGQPGMLVTVPVMGGLQVNELWIRATLTLDHAIKSNFEMHGGGRFSFGETEDYLAREGTVAPPRKKKKKKGPIPPPPVPAADCSGPWIDDEGSGPAWISPNFFGPYSVKVTVPAGANVQVTPSILSPLLLTITSTKEIDIPAVPFFEIVTVNIKVSGDGMSATTPCDILIWHDRDVQPAGALKYTVGSPSLAEPADTPETWAEDVLKYWLGLGPAPPGYDDFFNDSYGPTPLSHGAAASSARGATPTARTAATPVPYGGISSPVDGEVLAVAVKGTVRPTGQAGEPLLQGNGGVFSLAHIQVVRPQPDGSMTIISTSGGFNMPVGGDPNQITVVHPFNMCVQPGDELAFNWEGGFDPIYYPNGVTMQVFHSHPGTSIAVYHKHGGTMNGANFQGTPEQNTELLMQTEIGTGADASSNCPGGTGPSQKTPPPGAI
jgi:hypothetical protein